MRLFQYVVPTADNDARPYTVDHFRKWSMALIGYAGGYTDTGGAMGAWADSDGKLYQDHSKLYLVGIGDNGAETVQDTLRGIDAAFFDIFADQKAIFRAEIGTAEVIHRPQT